MKIMKSKKIELEDGAVIHREDGFHLMRVREGLGAPVLPVVLYGIPLHDGYDVELIVQSIDPASLSSEIFEGRATIIPRGVAALILARATKPVAGVRKTDLATDTTSVVGPFHENVRRSAAEIELQRIVSAEAMAAESIRRHGIEASEASAADGVGRACVLRPDERLAMGDRATRPPRRALGSAVMSGVGVGGGTTGGAGPTPTLARARFATQRRVGRDRRDAGGWHPVPKGGDA